MMWHAVCVHAATEDDGALMLPHPISVFVPPRAFLCFAPFVLCLCYIYIYWCKSIDEGTYVPPNQTVEFPVLGSPT
jgi:hypothetical protein